MARPCKEPSCGQPVLFAKDKETGRWQVLSNAAPMWRQCGKEKDGTPIVERVYDTLLSHFVNCKNPNRFAGPKVDPKQTELPIERDFSQGKEAE